MNAVERATAVADVNEVLRDHAARGWMLPATAERVIADNLRTLRGEVRCSAFAPFPGGVWRLVQTGPGLERRVAETLQLRGGVVYVPMETVWAGVGGRRRPHERPVVRGYVFALLPDAALYPLSMVLGVVRLVTHCGKVGVVDAGFVYELHAHELGGTFDYTLGERARAERAARLAVGDLVKIRAGKYAGYIGKVAQLKGDRRARLVIDMFGRIARPEVDIGALDMPQARSA
jgi:transcription antitermination factor NusG